MSPSTIHVAGFTLRYWQICWQIRGFRGTLGGKGPRQIIKLLIYLRVPFESLPFHYLISFDIKDLEKWGSFCCQNCSQIHFLFGSRPGTRAQ
jgi:hypothetical protein